MRIAYLCSDPGVPIGGSKGASIHVAEMCRAFVDLGHEVLLIAARGKPGGGLAAGQDAASGSLVPVVEASDSLDDAVRDAVRADPSADAGIAWTVPALLGASGFRHRAQARLADFRPDVIYERYSLFGTAGIAAAAELAAPLVLEVNAPLVDEQLTHRRLALAAAASELERRILTSADRIVAVSDPIRDWVVGRGVAPERVAVLPNGVDPARFAPAPSVTGPAAADARRPAGSETPVIGFLGTLKPWHDVAGLLRAAARLARAGRTLRLLVVGEGPERSALELLARDLGIDRSVTFTGGVPHDDVPRHLAAMDVAVAPYASSGPAYFSPLKLFEYLAAGLPVVAADIPGTRDCLAATGAWSYPPGDEEALASALEAALASPSRRREVGIRGRAHAVAQHTWRATASRALDLVAPVEVAA